MVRRGKVLIADDNFRVRGVLKKILSEDYDVVDVGDGVQAKDVLARDSIDLLITDLRMPNMSGEELLIHVKNFNPGLPTIIWTGNPDDVDIKPYLAEKNVSYLVKSENCNKVLARVQHSIWPRVCEAVYSEKPQALVVDNNLEDLFSYCDIDSLAQSVDIPLVKKTTALDVLGSFQNHLNGLVLLNYSFNNSGQIARTIRSIYPFTRIIAYSHSASESSETSDFISEMYPDVIDDFVLGGDINKKLETILQNQQNIRQDKITGRLRARPPRVFLVAGARGSGKSMLRNGAYSAMPWTYKFPSDTTGPRRRFERGTDHNFLSEDKFYDNMEKYLMVYYYEREQKECLYGLDRKLFSDALSSGRDVILSMTNPKVADTFKVVFDNMKKEWGVLSDLTTILVNSPITDLLYRGAQRPEGIDFEAIIEGHKLFNEKRDEYDIVIGNPGNYGRIMSNDMGEEEINVVNRMLKEFCRHVWNGRYDEKSPF